jgi:hypothetical protein
MLVPAKKLHSILRLPFGTLSPKATHYMDSVFSIHCRVVTRRRDIVRGDADKSLARPNSRCHRTESIVLLERGFCLFAELQVFSWYRAWTKACQATRAISTTSTRELSSRFVFLQGKAPKEIHTILTETLVEHVPSYPTVKKLGGQFKRGDFSTSDAPRSGRPKTFTTPEIIV